MNLGQAMARLGANVRRLRKEKGLSQEAMRDLGFNYRYFQKLEAGEVNVTLDTLVRLSNAFKCSPAELLG